MINIDKGFIGQGHYGMIFPVGQDLVVKVPKRSVYSDKIFNCYEIQNELYKKGINVPKPEGIVKVCVEEKFAEECGTSRFNVGFLMQRILGKDIVDFDKDDYLFNKYYFESRKQMNLAESLGFIPSDDSQYNVFVENGTNKVHLIDFDWWKKKN
jgi:RIO-like serine/threonine protein kinase